MGLSGGLQGICYTEPGSLGLCHYPSPTNQSPAWGHEWAKAGLGRARAGEPGSAGPRAGQGRPWELETSPAVALPMQGLGPVG